MAVDWTRDHDGARVLWYAALFYLAAWAVHTEE